MTVIRFLRAVPARGIPVVAASLVISTAYVWVRYVSRLLRRVWDLAEPGGAPQYTRAPGTVTETDRPAHSAAARPSAAASSMIPGGSTLLRSTAAKPREDGNASRTMTSPTVSGTARSAPAAPRIHAHTMTAMKTTSGLRLSSLAGHRLEELVLGEVDEGVANDHYHRRPQPAVEVGEDRRRDDRDDDADVRDEAGGEHEDRPQDRERHAEHEQEHKCEHRCEQAELGAHDEVAPQIGGEPLGTEEERMVLAEGRSRPPPERRPASA